MKKLLISLFLVTLVSLCFAKHNEDWKEWNITYYDYTDQSTHEFVFLSFAKRMATLENCKTLQGLNNPLVRQVNNIDNLYIAGLYTWLDYIKFALCEADGLKNLSKEEIEIYNEIFPQLDMFAKDFFDGDYTNGKDPASFSFMTPKLQEAFNGTKRSLRQMERYIDIKYYLKNPSAIPRLSKNQSKGKSSKGGVLPSVLFFLIIAGGLATAYLKREALLKIPTVANLLGKINKR